MLSKLRQARLFNPAWALAALLLVLSLVSFAPVIPLLGIYWDDWPSLWFLDLFGPAAFPQVFAADRPVQGALFILTTSLLGQSMPAWHLFATLARWAAALALAWTLAEFRPTWKPYLAWAAVPFLLYTGFDQHYIPITYSHQYLIYAAYLASHALLLRALHPAARHPWRLLAGSLLLAMLCLLSLEYFFGLELLRVVWLLWPLSLATGIGSAQTSPAAQPPTQRAVRRTAALAFLAANVAFLVWRLATPTPRGQVSLFRRLAEAPLDTALELLRTMLQDGLEAGVIAWGRLISSLPMAWAKPSYALPYLAVLLTAAAITLLYALRRQPEPGAARPPVLPWLALGLYGLLIGGWPFWATGLRIELAFPWDRFTLPLAVGASLLMGALGLGLQAAIDTLIRRLRPGMPARAWAAMLPGALLLSIFAGLAAGSQLRSAIAYRQDWLAQRDLLWQLAWRVPGLQPGSLLITSHLPLAYVTDNSLSAAINAMYAPDFSAAPGGNMPYLMYDLEARLPVDNLRLEDGQSVTQEYRAINFAGSTSQAVVFYVSPPRCLKLVSGPGDLSLPNKPEALLPAFPLARPELVSPTGPAEVALAALIGPPPAPGWCYYVEKVELALQFKDWPTALGLAEAARPGEQSLGREQAAELLPFVRAYAYNGRWTEALALSAAFERLQPKGRPALCAVWQELAPLGAAGSQAQAAISQAERDFPCRP